MERDSHSEATYAVARASIMDESLVTGRSPQQSLVEHVRRCSDLILKEKVKPSPNSDLVAILSESVRLARAYIVLQESARSARKAATG